MMTGTDAVGQVAEFLTAVLNTNVHTYAVSPVFSLIEVWKSECEAEMLPRLNVSVFLTSPTVGSQPDHGKDVWHGPR